MSLSSSTAPSSYFSKKTKTFSLWLLLGMIFSLLIHFFILRKIGGYEIASFNPASFDPIIPRKFHLEKVTLDPKLLELPEPKKTVLPLKSVALPEKEMMAPQEIPQDAGKAPAALGAIELPEEKPAAFLEKNIIPGITPKPQDPLLLVEENGAEDSSLGSITKNQASIEGSYSQLDQLLTQQETLSSQTAPILMPTDLLFEYNADQLKRDAEKSLEKLALLIQRNPKALFIITGYTDSFGSDAYNLDLSRRRADSIKKWLIEKQAIDKNQIQAEGLGKTHFLVSSKGSIEAQGLNRRVEIVIRKKD